MTLVPDICPTCRSNDPNVCATGCYNPWHRGLVVHLQKEPIGATRDACHAACSAPIDDPPSELAVDRAFVSCPTCLSCDRAHVAPTCADPACYREEHAKKADAILQGLGDLVRQGKLDPDPSTNEKLEKLGDTDGNPWSEPAKVIRRHQELSDEEVDRATLDDLRVAYRSLRDHHVTETTALVSRRDDLTRRRDDLLARNQQVLTQSQQLIERASTIMQSDAANLDRLGSENARLTEIVDTAAKLLASRVADPTNPTMPDYLSDDELATWLDRAGLACAALEGTYLRLVLDELRERRDAEAMFVDADLQLQRIADCEACAENMHGTDHEHRAILKRWRIAQAALCALARIHRGYLISVSVPSEGDPR
jgi:hypothetical protein